LALDSERQRFSSRILPRYARRSPRVTDVLPVLYLRGLSSGDFGPALRELLGEDASEAVVIVDLQADGALARGASGVQAPAP